MISTHEGPCCDSCLEDTEDYPIYNDDWVRLCCCYELKRPAA